MLPDEYQWIGLEFEPEGDPWRLLQIARSLESAGNLEGAATVYDRAFGLAPREEEIHLARQGLLQRLAVVEHGIVYRYIPGGVFLMGRSDGEADERPWHPVWLVPYWMSETPISWATYCRLMDWEPPPHGAPREPPAAAGEFDRAAFHLYEANKLRLQYCEDQTTAARDWHAHTPGAAAIFGTPTRRDPETAWQYAAKPMVAVAWQEAEELARHLSNKTVRYDLPTEAQWEKAARGGLIAARHAWGDDPPNAQRCDFDRFGRFAILPMRTFPPNGYGLYAVNGGVWEWTGDWYDREYYAQSPQHDPTGPATGEEKVLRGGSWADCAEVVTVSYRMSRASSSWRQGEWSRSLAPNIGFRLCRTVPASAE
jgi:formylglycine-generating enzyme required for sulfatase activity